MRIARIVLGTIALIAFLCATVGFIRFLVTGKQPHVRELHEISYNGDVR